MNKGNNFESSKQSPLFSGSIINPCDMRPTFETVSVKSSDGDCSKTDVDHLDGLSDTQEKKAKRSKTRGRGTHPDRFKCPHCPKTLKNASCYNKHLLTHTGNWPLRCEICNKGFLYKFHLTEHMRTHTGERPFTCRYCGKRSAATSTHNAHERKCKNKSVSQRQRLADLERNRRISPAYINNAENDHNGQSSSEISISEDTDSQSITTSTSVSVSSSPVPKKTANPYELGTPVQCGGLSDAPSATESEGVPKTPQIKEEIVLASSQNQFHPPFLRPMPPPFINGPIRPPWPPPPFSMQAPKRTRVAFPATGSAFTPPHPRPTTAGPITVPRLAGIPPLPGPMIVDPRSSIVTPIPPVSAGVPSQIPNMHPSIIKPKVVTKLVITPVYMFEWK